MNPHPTSKTDKRREGVTLQSLRRSIATFGLWAFGVVAILGSLISLSLLIAVPLLSLENDRWAREDNPHTLANVVLYAAIGVAAIVAARRSNRVRFFLGVQVFAAFSLYALYDLGLFGG